MAVRTVRVESGRCDLRDNTKESLRFANQSASEAAGEAL